MSNVTSVSAGRSGKPKKTAVKILAYLFLILLAIIILIPFWAIFAGTFEYKKSAAIVIAPT